jgi:hypothetical protein
MKNLDAALAAVQAHRRQEKLIDKLHAEMWQRAMAQRRRKPAGRVFVGMPQKTHRAS